MYGEQRGNNEEKTRKEQGNNTFPYQNQNFISISRKILYRWAERTKAVKKSHRFEHSQKMRQLNKKAGYFKME